MIFEGCGGVWIGVLTFFEGISKNLTFVLGLLLPLVKLNSSSYPLPPADWRELAVVISERISLHKKID